MLINQLKGHLYINQYQNELLINSFRLISLTCTDATTCSDPAEFRYPSPVIPRPSEDDNQRRQIASTDVVVHT